MHVMIDVEAWGTRPGDAVFQIGAVAFELNGTVLEPHELMQYEDRWFNARLAPYGAPVMPETIEWWGHADRAVPRQRIMDMAAEPIEVVLARFNKFVEPWLGKRGYMWARGPQFDFPMLDGVYKAANMKPVWAYNQTLDARTTAFTASKIAGRAFVGPDMTGLGLIKHFALHDAVIQAVTTQAAWRCLQGGRRN